MKGKPDILSNRSLVEGVLAWWRIRQALRALQGSSEDQHRAAVEALVASSPRCWHGLRKIAFKEKGVRSVSAAKLLFDLGDAQGLFALLEQYSSLEVRREAEAYLDQSLRQIGPQQIEALLKEAIRSLERRPLGNGTWGLAVAVYAMRVLEDFRHVLPQSLLTQCILLSQPDYDSFAASRSVFPFTAFTDCRVARPETVNDFYVGSSVAAVRRVATDILVGQEDQQAFSFLGEALAHSNPQVQYAALYGLCRLRDERALPLFQRIASNRKHPLAHDAQRAIELFGTKLPDILTLVRGSQLSSPPDELLRPATYSEEKAPETLLRPSSAATPPAP
jgi:HEAT repeat protein